MIARAEWIAGTEPSAAAHWGSLPVMLGALSRAGVPVAPSFVISAGAIQEMLLEPKLRNEAERIANDHDYKSPQHFAGVAKDLQKLIGKLSFPSKLSAELTFILTTLHEVTMLDAKKGIRVTARYCTASGSTVAPAHTGVVHNMRDLEKLVRELLLPLFELQTLHKRITERNSLLPEAGSVLIEYAEPAHASGVAQCFDPIELDGKTIYLTAHFHESAGSKHHTEQDIYRFDRATMLPLTLAHGTHRWRQTIEGTHHSAKRAEAHHAGVLSEAEQVQLARLTRQAQQAIEEPMSFTWVLAHRQFFITGAEPIQDTAPMQTVPSSHVPLAVGLTANLGKVTGRATVITKKSDWSRIKPGDIVVLRHLAAADKKLLFDAAALIVETGTSVGGESQIAQQLGIPAIVGAHAATSMIGEGQLITVDATHGAIYAGTVTDPTPFVSHAPITGTQVSLLLSDPLSVNHDVLTEVDGVALIRGEFLLELAATHPDDLIKKGRLAEYEAILSDVVGRIAELAFPKAVVYQFHDIHSTGVLHMMKAPDRHEPNPRLGMRGTRRLLHESDLFVAELRVLAALRARGLTNLETMLPMVRSVSEYDEACRAIQQYWPQHEAMPPLWLRCETPALAIVAEDLATRQPHGVCFDVPALAQLITGTDAENYQVAHYLNQADQAVLDALGYAISTLNASGVHTSILAEGEELRPEVIATAIRAGVSEVAVHRADVEPVRRMIASIEQLIVVEHARSASASLGDDHSPHE